MALLNEDYRSMLEHMKKLDAEDYQEYAYDGKSFFDDTVELLDAKTVGEYSSCHCIHLYKYYNLYVVMDNYVGSCEGCIGGYDSDFDIKNLIRRAYTTYNWNEARAEYDKIVDTDT